MAALIPAVLRAADSRCNAPNACLAWSARFNGPSGGSDYAQGVAVSPNGAQVYVVGFASWPASERDHALVAYDALSGQQQWVGHYDAGEDWDFAYNVLASHDGALVYLIGWSLVAGNRSLVVVAFEAASGDTIWVRHYVAPGISPPGGNFPSHHVDKSGMSPDGRTLYLAGSIQDDVLVLAYDAATGNLDWTSRYGEGPPMESQAFAVAPDGRSLYLAGTQQQDDGTTDYLAVAFDAATGAVRWAATYNGPLDRRDKALGVTVSPDASRVYLTGTADGIGRYDDLSNIVTVALDAVTGAQLWNATYDGEAGGDEGRSVAVSPWGDLVYVTGVGRGANSEWDAFTLAYDAATGAQAWLARFEGNGEWEWGSELRVAPGGHRVYVTGLVSTPLISSNFLTLAYDAATGLQVWEQEWNMANVAQDEGYALAIAPAGDRLYVTGYSYLGSSTDMATAGYGPLTVPPIAMLSADSPSGEAPHTVTFSLSGIDADGLVDGWKLDADGDQVADYEGLGLPPATVTHTYGLGGEFIARLTIADDHGAVGTDTVGIAVSGTTTGVPGGAAPRLSLEMARPNPFSATTEITYVLPFATVVRLAAYDLAGRRVDELAHGTRPPGRHTARWDARHLPNGTYLLRLEAGREVKVTRVTLNK